MQPTTIARSYFEARYSLFKWRSSLAVTNKIILALGMACVTGLVAQVKFNLFFTPVPITGQTFAVLLAGVLLGRGWAGVSQVIYVIIGAAGVPWFAGASGGLGAIFGSGGGYIIGFIFAALFVGHFSDKYIRARSFLPMFGLMAFANFALIHIPGLIGLGLQMYLVKGSAASVGTLLWLGSIPFIPGDILKIAAAAALAKAVTPKRAFDR